MTHQPRRTTRLLTETTFVPAWVDEDTLEDYPSATSVFDDDGDGVVTLSDGVDEIQLCAEDLDAIVELLQDVVKLRQSLMVGVMQ